MSRQKRKRLTKASRPYGCDVGKPFFITFYFIAFSELSR